MQPVQSISGIPLAALFSPAAQAAALRTAAERKAREQTLPDVVIRRPAKKPAISTETRNWLIAGAAVMLVFLFTEK